MSLLRKQPSITSATRLAETITLKFDVPISHQQGDTTARWRATTFLGPRNPELVKIEEGNIKLVFEFPGIFTRVEYRGPPPPIKAVNGVILEAFQTDIPFP